MWCRGTGVVNTGSSVSMESASADPGYVSCLRTLDFLQFWDSEGKAVSGAGKHGRGTYPPMGCGTEAVSVSGSGRVTTFSGAADEELGVENEFIIIVVLNYAPIDQWL